MFQFSLKKLKVLLTNPKPIKTIKIKIEGTDLGQIRKTENKDEVSDSRTEVGSQKQKKYKSEKIKNSGEKNGEIVQKFKM